ncbi:MAG: heavy metal translocating P-type ATPase [Kiloniellaceae bacterium]
MSGHPTAAGLADKGILQASSVVDDSLRQTDLSVPSIRCGGCIWKIEQALNALDGVERARVNLSTKRVCVLWRADREAPPLIRTLADVGYAAHLEEPGNDTPDRTLSELIRALAVAGFATGNIMLLSVSVWSGADAAARDLFHGVSALIALPALVYSGRIFFRSAARAIRHGRTNMDVPISIGVLLAFGLSLFETFEGGEQAYFEASVMLLFFLLIGRTLDHLMREKARRAVSGLAKLVPRVVQVVRADGHHVTRPLSSVEPGMSVLVAAGERVPVDGRVAAGLSDVDRSLVTGESAPQSAGVGSVVQAGMLNLTGPLTVTATAAEAGSFLADMVRLMERAEAGRPVYRRVADRATRFYAPLVHGVALASFVGWMVAAGDLHQATVVAVAVLIITCPCALGLAVPMVQVVAARRLFERGIMIKDGAVLERLTDIDAVVFDKTGTLTMGAPVLRNRQAIAPENLALAAALGAQSRHPLSRALAAFEDKESPAMPVSGHVTEHPGCGLEALSDHGRFRLGRAAWALDAAARPTPGAFEDSDQTETVLSKDGELLEVFRFDDPLRPGAREAVGALKARGIEIHLLSGDRAGPVRRLAGDLGLDVFEAALRPRDKVAYLEGLAEAGHKVLMVGDGLNDAPALAAAQVSMAPGTAADVGRNAAGLVFLGDGLEAVPFAVALSHRADRLIRQNFLLAIVYNGAALPFAVLGFVTPLVAAVAMSLSSIAVVANALRLNAGSGRRRRHEGTKQRRPAFALETTE